MMHTLHSDLKETERKTLETEDEAQTRLNSAMPFVLCSVVPTTTYSSSILVNLLF